MMPIDPLVIVFFLSPFHATVFFLYSLKQEKTRGSLMLSEGLVRDQWHKMVYGKNTTFSKHYIFEVNIIPHDYAMEPSLCKRKCEEGKKLEYSGNKSFAQKCIPSTNLSPVTSSQHWCRISRSYRVPVSNN